MNRSIFLLAAICALSMPVPAQSIPAPGPNRALARDIFRELIDIDTTDSVGSVTKAATAMRDRLLAAGFPAVDLTLAGPTPLKQNLVARYRAVPASNLRPMLIIAHLDVVEAKRADWTTPPFTLTEKDGYFYGRGTQDMKDSDAALVAAFIRMRREGFKPNRDIILALTADEEGGKSNGVDYLLTHHRDLVDAAFAINPDAGGPELEQGRPVSLGVEATEKLYADYRITAVSPGGHSSLPRPDNPIYHVAEALARLDHAPFPLETNEITRAYFAAVAPLKSGETSADLKRVAAQPPDPAAASRLSADPVYNSLLHTTCVATMLSAGHAPNALPATAVANVNCRIFPGHSQEEIRQSLIHTFADSTLKVEYVTDAGEVLGEGSNRKSMTPPAPLPAVFEPLAAVVRTVFGGTPIIPEMETGASDSVYTMNAGIPTYGFSGMGVDRDDIRAHGRDERIRIADFDRGAEFQYLYLKALTAR